MKTGVSVCHPTLAYFKRLEWKSSIPLEFKKVHNSMDVELEGVCETIFLRLGEIVVKNFAEKD